MRPRPDLIARLLMVAAACSVLIALSVHDASGRPNLAGLGVDLLLLLAVRRWHSEAARFVALVLAAFGAVLFTGSAVTGSAPWFVPLLVVVQGAVLMSSPVRAHVAARRTPVAARP